LEHVLCVLERAEHPVGVSLQLAAVALDELREGSLVSGCRRVHELLFGNRSHVHALLQV
jgi:hypothetical protein